MNRNELVAVSLISFFFLVGFLIMFEQYWNYGEWFQIKDLHHETFALSSFAFAIGILVGFSVRAGPQEKNS